jgi:N-carbamoyl-L-amino-acid hydrolase
MIPTIDAERLWQSTVDIATIGPTPQGGSWGLALIVEDTAVSALFLRWCQALGLRHEQDAIGNMFLRQAGTDSIAPAVACGSHLATCGTLRWDRGCACGAGSAARAG